MKKFLVPSAVRKGLNVRMFSSQIVGYTLVMFSRLLFMTSLVLRLFGY
jgi:hypothetical protein